MRLLACLLIIPLALLATGCGSSLNDTAVEGQIDPDSYHDAMDSNQQRLAGEDHPVPITGVMSPFQMISVAYRDGIARPIELLVDKMNHDTEGIAAHAIKESKSPDRRREAVLRLVDFKEDRSGPSLTVYAALVTDPKFADPDYTVRAAAIRALNRSRAKGHTIVFLKGLMDGEYLVRLESAKALANIPDNAAIPQLLYCLQQDDSKDVRIACADALRNYKTIPVTNALVDLLGDKEFSVAWQARQSLELMTGQDFRYDENAWLSYLSKNKVSG